MNRAVLLELEKKNHVLGLKKNQTFTEFNGNLFCIADGTSVIGTEYECYVSARPAHPGDQIPHPCGRGGGHVTQPLQRPHWYFPPEKGIPRTRHC